MDSSHLLKGDLDAAVRAVLQEADAYGYDVVCRMGAAGFAQVGETSVYGALSVYTREGPKCVKGAIRRKAAP